MTNPGYSKISELFQNTLEERCSRNPKYSLRAFARDLGISPQRLSHLMNGKKGLSRAAAAALVQRLGLSASEGAYFLQVVEAKHSRSKKIRERASAQLAPSVSSYRTVDLDRFKILADWHHLALTTLCELDAIPASPSFVAKRLGISLLQARAAVRRLLDFEMIEERDGCYRSTGFFFAGGQGLPSAAIRRYHSQALEQAQIALSEHPIEERDFSTMFFSVDDGQIGEARAAIKNFREEFERRFSNSATKKKQVYALGIQYFRADQKPALTKGKKL